LILINRLYVYGGFEIESGINDDFFELPIVNVEKFQWKKVPVSKKSKVKPGNILLALIS
jgi:hypothetical protein